MTRRPRSSALGEPRIPTRGSPGFSLVESVVVVALIAVTLAAALPVLDRVADTADAAAAARYLAGRIGRARLEAAREQHAIALRVGRRAPFLLDTVVDGDGDGITAADIADGTDAVRDVADALGDHFPRARLAIIADVPGIDDGGGLRAGDDAVRLGAAGHLSLSPAGTSSGGTIYVASRGVQFAVRIAGATGRARVLRFDPGGRSWRPY